MTAHEAIELFYNEMANEIFHHVTNEDLQETLLRSLKETKSTAITTLDASA